MRFRVQVGDQVVRLTLVQAYVLIRLGYLGEEVHH